MTFRKIGPSDVAGVTRVCNNLQILFASIPQFSDFGFLREKMPNRCVAAGCPIVPDPSKSIGLLMKTMIRRGKDGDVGSRSCEIVSHRYNHAFAHSILKCVNRTI